MATPRNVGTYSMKALQAFLRSVIRNAEHGDGENLLEIPERSVNGKSCPISKCFYTADLVAEAKFCPYHGSHLVEGVSPCAEQTLTLALNAFFRAGGKAPTKKGK